MVTVRKTNDPRETLLDPGARVWAEAEAVTLELQPAPVAMQPSEYIRSTVQQAEVGAVKRLQVRALHNGGELAFRLEWDDPQPDVDVEDPGAFADGAAIMFPFGADAPLITMGSPDQPVNQWHWRADLEAAYNVTTAGLGTTYRTPQRIAAQGRWQGGRWTVTFVRALVDPDNQVAFRAGETLKAAFCVWEGSRQERAGLKAFSPQWTEFALEA